MHLLVYGKNLSRPNLVRPTVRRITGKIKRKVVGNQRRYTFQDIPIRKSKDRSTYACRYLCIHICTYSCRPDVANIFFGDLPPENCQSLLGDTGTCTTGYS